MNDDHLNLVHLFLHIQCMMVDSTGEFHLASGESSLTVCFFFGNYFLSTERKKNRSSAARKVGKDLSRLGY